MECVRPQLSVPSPCCLSPTLSPPLKYAASKMRSRKPCRRNEPLYAHPQAGVAGALHAPRAPPALRLLPRRRRVVASALHRAHASDHATPLNCSAWRMGVAVAGQQQEIQMGPRERVCYGSGSLHVRAASPWRQLAPSVQCSAVLHSSILLVRRQTSLLMQF